MSGKIKNIFGFCLLLTALLLPFNCLIPKASAATLSIPVTENWDNCVGSVDGQTSGDQPATAYFGVNNGDTANLTINNTSPTETITINMDTPDNPPSQQISPQGTYNTQLTVNSIITITATDSNCPTGNSNSTIFYIYNGSGNLSCSLSGKNWLLSGQFSNVAPYIYLYQGSTFNTDFSAVNNSVTISYQQHAQSTPQTYYLYNGSSSNYGLIGTATCSPPATTTTSSTTTKSSTTKSIRSSTTGLIKTPSSGITYSAVSAKNKTKLWSILVPILIILGLILIFEIACLAVVFKKASKHWWAAIIPVYSLWVIYELGGEAGWWSLVMLIPVVNIMALVMLIFTAIEISKRFGHKAAFAIFGLLIFSFIGWPILAFSKAKYKLPKT